MQFLKKYKWALGAVLLLVVLSVSIFYYRQFTDQNMPDNLTDSADEVIQGPAKGKKTFEFKKASDGTLVKVPKNDSADGQPVEEEASAEDDNHDDDPDLKVDSTNAKSEKAIDEAEADEMTAYFEATEKAWGQRMDDLITGEFGLGVDALKKYNVLREGLDRDKMEAFNEYHKYMREKHGDNYSYIPTKDEEQFGKKLRIQYEEKVRDFFGDKNYQRYKEVRQEFNQKLRKEQNPNVGVMEMDL